MNGYQGDKQVTTYSLSPGQPEQPREAVMGGLKVQGLPQYKQDGWHYTGSTNTNSGTIVLVPQKEQRFGDWSNTFTIVSGFPKALQDVALSICLALGKVTEPTAINASSKMIQSIISGCRRENGADQNIFEAYDWNDQVAKVYWEADQFLLKNDADR